MLNSVGGAFSVGEGYTVWQALLCEVMLSFLLHIVSIMSSLEWDYPFSSIATGLAVTAGISSG